MSDIFKDMQVKTGCGYISDLPSHKRIVWKELKKQNLSQYDKKQLDCELLTERLPSLDLLHAYYHAIHFYEGAVSMIEAARRKMIEYNSVTEEAIHYMDLEKFAGYFRPKVTYAGKAVKLRTEKFHETITAVRSVKYVPD